MGNVRRRAPALGENSVEVLKDSGFSEDEVGSLVERGMV